MPVNAKLVMERADKIVGAWKKSAANKTFGELTATQYEAIRQAASTADAAVTTAEAVLTEARNDYAASLNALNEASTRVVNGVRGDVSVGGENGSLYEAMGYVRKAERKTGLTRKSTKAKAEPKG
jgi:hypothetical protein